MIFGPEMPEPVRSQIFDHLLTTKAVGKGIGLGLSIAQQIITQQHQGQIAVQSTVSVSTTFSLTLPLNLAVPSPQQPNLRPQQLAATSRLT